MANRVLRAGERAADSAAAQGGNPETEGKFEIEHREFLLFPTYLHQNIAMLKSTEHAEFSPAGAEPEQITISAGAAITDIIKMPSREVMDALDDLHIWTAPLIDMRFNYRPDRPLYLLLVRAYRLHQPISVANTAGVCGVQKLGAAGSASRHRRFSSRAGRCEIRFSRQTILDRINQRK